MLEIICAVIGAALTALTAITAGYKGWALLWTMPIFIGYFLAVIAFFFIFAFVASLPENVNKDRNP